MFLKKVTFLTLFVFTCSAACLAKTEHDNNPKIVAHRGKACGYPENSLSGFEQVLKNGADYIEIDVRTTADGFLVISHDGSLKRTTKSKEQIRDLSFSELQQVRLKRKFRGGQNEKIPTLEQVCKLVSGHNQAGNNPVNLYVDCKDADPAQMISTLKQYGLEKDAVFYGSDSYLKKLRDEFPQAQIIPALKNLDELDKKIKALSPFGFDTNWKILNEETVRQIHEKYIKIYTDLLFINDRRNNYKKAQQWGIDAIQTDRYKRAYKTLQKQK